MVILHDTINLCHVVNYVNIIRLRKGAIISRHLAVS